MADEMYPVADDEQKPDAHDGMDEEHEGEHMDEPTALIPKALLGGKTFNVGDEVVLEIVHMGDGEVEVKYAKEKPGEYGADEGKPEMGKSDADMMAMMNKGA